MSLEQVQLTVDHRRQDMKARVKFVGNVCEYVFQGTNLEVHVNILQHSVCQRNNKSLAIFGIGVE